MTHLNASQLQDFLKENESKPLLLDVREQWEYELCHIEGSAHTPMAEIHQALDELDKARDIVLICHHGVRSRQVGTILEHAGFKHVINLSKGIHGWAQEIDPMMATY
jgi:rhodanese-related sulfurtransferase